MRRSLLAALFAGLFALGAVACEADDTGDPLTDDPAVDDGGLDDGGLDDGTTDDGTTDEGTDG